MISWTNINSYLKNLQGIEQTKFKKQSKQQRGIYKCHKKMFNKGIQDNIMITRC
jgi:hypothetical protein